MSVFFYISVFSAGGMIYLFMRGLGAVRAMGRKELSLKLISSKSVFDGFHLYVFVPLLGFLKTFVLSTIFKEFEIIISKFRIIVLKVERRLFHLSSYIRGKREINGNNESHPYWDSVNSSKNDTDKK